MLCATLRAGYKVILEDFPIRLY